MTDSSDGSPHVHVDVVSDVICPWCYIGKHRLEGAIASTPEIVVDVDWRPYFLNPWIPREGIDRKTYLETKFGSVQRYDAIAERVAAAAAAEGLVYAPDKISRQPNTLGLLWLPACAGMSGNCRRRRVSVAHRFGCRYKLN